MDMLRMCGYNVWTNTECMDIYFVPRTKCMDKHSISMCGQAQNVWIFVYKHRMYGETVGI